MMKYRLMAPGPTPIPEDVMLEMAKPIWHHRTKDFENVLAQVVVDLKALYQTQNDLVLLASSGSGAMEACLSNVTSPKDAVLVIEAGKFGERFTEIAKAFDLEVDVIQVEWGYSVNPKEVEARLKQKNYAAVCVQANETSTGVLQPIYELGKLVSELPNTVLIVDAITALGVSAIPTDAWALDMVIGGSQKALMLPPGLAMISVSEKAWRLMKDKKNPKHYFDLQKERKALLKNTTAYTPAVSIIMGLKLVLEKFRTEGFEAVYQRQALLAESVREAAKAIGLKLFAKENPSSALTAIQMPQGLDSEVFVKNLKSKFNITIAEGQDRLKGKIFRIGHIGYYDLLDMVAVFAAVEKELHNMGYSFEMGQGVKQIIQRL